MQPMTATTTTQTTAEPTRGPVPDWWLEECGDYHGSYDREIRLWKRTPAEALACLRKECRKQIEIYDSPANCRLHDLLPTLDYLREEVGELVVDPTLQRFRETDEVD